MNSEFELFPEAASTAAGAVDGLFLFMVAMSTVISLAVAALILFFAIKYRRGSLAPRAQAPTNERNEIIWMVASLPVLMFIFAWGARVGFLLLRQPQHGLPITVVAKQWMWKFQHADGRREIDTLHVPVGEPVRLTMISQDVIHSFYVPAFRVKQDVLPGRYASLWFNATTPGEYRLYCAEYCGTNHSRMVGKIIAQTPADFANWKSGRTGDEPPHVSGEKLFERLQCVSCRRAGEGQRGPPLEGIYNRSVALQGGGMVVADDSYLRESILRPATKVVAGFQPVMPTYEGQISEEDILHLLAYIRSLAEKGGARP
jgi:cytochrome c oxidase subunit 2